MARPSAAADVFSAVSGVQRRRVMDSLADGEKAVGTIVTELSISQPQVSKHLRVLSSAGLVKCRAEGRRRIYRLDPVHLRPLREWMARYEHVMSDRLDLMGDYLNELQGKEQASDA